MEAKYSDNVLDYIRELEALNLRVGVIGLTWREITKASLPHSLREKLPFVQGGKPHEDDALIAVAKEICLSRAVPGRRKGQGKL